ncbi:MAG: ComEC/Rec2 family competence protein [Candidatus Paceibacterota bacterium]
MGRSDIFLILCLAFAGGIFIASFFILELSMSLVLIGLVCGIGLIGIFWKNRSAVFVGFCLLSLIAGAWFFHSSYSKRTDNIITENCGEVVVLGRIAREPQIGYKNARFIISAREIIKENGERLKNENKKELGKIIVYADQYAVVNYGDEVELKGKLALPEEIEGFDYRSFLAKDGISAMMAYPEIKIISQNNFNNIFGLIYNKIILFKEMVRVEMQKNLAIKEETILQAMILGDNAVIADNLKLELSKSGLSHAIAISGMHIVLFSAFIFQIFLALGFWKKQAATASLFLIIVYVVLAGSPASAVRSGIMGGLLLFGQIIDRAAYAERSLVLAGFFILLQNPLALRYDLGFELSFLAVAGMIFAGPMINDWLSKVFHNRLKYFREIIAATLSAQLLTLPVLIQSFGYVSIISLISNILVIPVLPALMVLGIVFPLIGLLIPLFGWFLSIFCSLLIKYLILIVRWSANIPFAVLNVEIWIGFIVVFYLLVFFVLWRKQREDYLEIFWG